MNQTTALRRPSKEQITPMGEWFTLEPVEVDRVSSGGIMMPGDSSQIDRYGRILKVGPGFYQNGCLVELRVKPGQLVMYRDGRGISLRFDGENIIFMTERDLLAIIE